MTQCGLSRGPTRPPAPKRHVCECCAATMAPWNAWGRQFGRGSGRIRAVARPRTCVCVSTLRLRGWRGAGPGRPVPSGARRRRAGRAPPGDMRYIYIQGLEKQETAPSQPALNHARLHAHPTPLPDRNCSCVFVTLARRSPLCGHKREGGQHQQGPHYR